MKLLPETRRNHMAKKTIKRPLRPGSDEIEEVEVENGDDAPVEGELPSQMVPYPTGNPWVPPPPEPTPATPAAEPSSRKEKK